MQIRTELMAKNLTDKTLHLLTARPVRPKIHGEVLQVFIHTGADSNHGPDCLPPGATLHTSIMIMISGLPAGVRGKTMPPLAAVLAVCRPEGKGERAMKYVKTITPPIDNVPCRHPFPH